MQTNAKKIIKFNMYMSFILLMVMVLMFVAATVAYFSDHKQVTNTMTAGDVEIMLSESAVKSDEVGNLVADPLANRILGGTEIVVNNYGKVYPSQTIYKDPTVKNIGSLPAWIAAKVTFSEGGGDLAKVMGYDSHQGVDIEVLLSGGLLDEPVRVGNWNGFDHVCFNERYAMVQVPNDAEGEYAFYFFLLDPLESDKTVLLFDTFTVPAEWNNTEMRELEDLKIKVEAFAVQTFNLDSCFGAMTDAFPDYFNFN